ncbi:MAG: DNA-binding response regulator [Bacteroidetes bacterium]|nr:MAG: DNA-binding response regulator [Bacteroidota bacterium]
MQVKCLIVDDEPIARDILESYIQKIEGLELVKSCQNAFEALNYLHQQPVDLIFLDIQMPGLNGMELMKSMPRRPSIILTTAFREYAVESYEMEVLDYLLKPIPFERFLAAVNKYFQHAQAGNNPAPAPPASTGPDYIYLSVGKRMVKIFLQDILYIESQRDAIKVKTLREELLVHRTISFAEQKLPAQEFVRIHRSFIVAIDKIEAYSAISVTIGGKELPIGRNYKNEVSKLLKSISNSW